MPNRMKKKQIQHFVITGLGCLTALTLPILSQSLPAKAGANLDGINWCGVFDSTWGSSTGEYHSPITVECTGQTGPATGTYNNGKLSGTVYYIYDNAGNASALRFRGQWERTQGSSGGQCPYGQFSLDLTVSGAEDASGYPVPRFLGAWTYCNDDPEGLTPKWAWYGYERR
jgi:hypothetical protein